MHGIGNMRFPCICNVCELQAEEGAEADRGFQKKKEIMEYRHLEEVLQRYANEFAEQLKERLRDGNAIASGTLVNSIKHIYEHNGNVYSVSISLADYWKYVNSDTKPHWPPVSAIKKWIEVKPVIPYVGSNGKLPTVEQLAFLISRKIAREGTKGNEFFDLTQEDINARFMQDIEYAIAEDLNEELEDLLYIP